MAPSRPPRGGRDYGDSALKLNGALRVTDYFTPYNQKQLSATDRDLGSGGALLVPDQPGPRPHLLIGGSKDGTLYVLNRDNLGHYRPRRNRAPQTIPNPGHPIFSTPVHFNADFRGRENNQSSDNCRTQR
jgi:hypothetical protein